VARDLTELTRIIRRIEAKTRTSNPLASPSAAARPTLEALLDGAAGLQEKLPLAEKRLVSADIRPDVQHENGLIRYLPRWFNHSELKFNLSASETAGAWLADHLAGASRAG